jgi:integrase
MAINQCECRNLICKHIKRNGEMIMIRKQFGTIRKLASGKYQARYFLDGVQQAARTLDDKPMTFATYDLARKFLNQLELDLDKGINPYEIERARKKSQSYTLRQRVEMYVDPIAGARLTHKPLRAATVRNYEHLSKNYLFRQIDGFCLSEMLITEITRADVRKWYQLIQSQCVSGQSEIKTRAHPARAWARSEGIPTALHGRIDQELITQWINAGAPMIKSYRKTNSGIVQLAKAYTFLHAIFNVALEDEIIEQNPCRIKGAGQPKHPERPIATLEQLAALASEVPERYKLSVILAAFTSIRSSELFGLQRKHINPLHRTLKIEHQLTQYASDPEMFVAPKTDSSLRTVPIPDDLMGAINEHLEKFVTDPNPDALIFTTSNGLPLYKGRKSWWVTAKRRLNLDHLHFHDLRHTGQSLALANGASIKDLQRRAGQSTAQAAQMYLHGSIERDQIVADSLNPDVSKTLNLINRKRVS